MNLMEMELAEEMKFGAAWDCLSKWAKYVSKEVK